MMFKSLHKSLYSFVSSLTISLAFSLNVLAAPLNGQVIAGSAVIQNIDTQNMSVTQGTSTAIINWNQFNIGAAEKVTFIQPNASSIMLNRVTGIDPSVINGAISANGRVFLTNPNGVLFGASSVVNVSSFMASTLNITDKDFLSGNYNFSQATGQPLASILNQGSINATDGGFVSLVAPSVVNEGKIVANLGSVYLGAGKELVLSFSRDSLIGFAVDGVINGSVIGTDGTVSDAGVINTGIITANGGTVVLNATTAYDTVKAVVNNDGIIEAQSLSNIDGTIVLESVGNGIAENRGTLDVSGLNPGETGGTVNVLGQYVGLYDGSVINANGYSNAGTVLVGGDFQGNGVAQNAFRTYVAPTANIYVNSINNGNGGRAIVWADDVNRYYGNISAQGGLLGGNGGFVEVSGKRKLNYLGKVLLDAPSGVAGSLLLDPLNITISGGADANTAGFVAAGDQTEAFADDTGLNSVFNVGSSFTGSTGTITLQATNDITVSNAFNVGTATGNTSVSLVLQAGNDINVNALITTTGSGTISLTVNDAASGAATGTGVINLNADLTTAGAGITLNGAILVNNAAVTIDGTNGGLVTAGSDIRLNSSIDSAFGQNYALTVNGGTAGTVNLTNNTGMGTTAALSSLTLTGSQVRPPVIVNTTGNQSYTAGIIRIDGADTVLSSSGGDVMFNGAIDANGASTQNLTVNATLGAITYGADVIGTTYSPLLSLTSNAATINLPATVTTTGAQSYTGAVTLAGTTIINTTNSNVSFLT
ncbi:MAG: filamentous hemagglutinin N-terminal domain-containing protein, partial [Gammaproteobacteria bacterium]|nr:filamentous hemagglutinin N-terminal domain-containing protein [Gammaproteobacteria bacterium]